MTHLGAILSTERPADELFAKKLIAKDMLDETSLPSLTNTDKIRDLICTVLALVEMEPSNYHKFLQTASALSGAKDIVRLLSCTFFFCIIFLLTSFDTKIILFALLPSALAQGN